jgi:glutathione S-transferase
MPRCIGRSAEIAVRTAFYIAGPRTARGQRQHRAHFISRQRRQGRAQQCAVEAVRFGMPVDDEDLHDALNDRFMHRGSMGLVACIPSVIPARRKSMIEVHHLNASRSRRITWLCEELGLDYRLVSYQRDATTNLAPPELKSIHPLGKSPVIRDNGEVIFESGAIIEYLIRRYGNGRLAPATTSADYNRYMQFLHYAEGSAMLPLMLRLYVGRLGDAGAPLMPRIQSETDNHLGFLNNELNDRDYIVGNDLTGADVQLSFVAQVGAMFCGRDAFPNLTRYVDRIEARPAYQRAVEKAGA